MSQTNVGPNSKFAVTIENAALFAGFQKENTWSRTLTGKAPAQADAEAKMKSQTSKDYPIVEITDLSVGAGTRATVDLIDMPTGIPIPGDRNAEGKGDSLSTSSMDIDMDMVTFSVDAGGKMSQKRTKNNLRSLARTATIAKAGKFADQSILVHLSGSRGTINESDMIVPMPDHDDYASLMVNPVMAPTYNRHFVADASTLIGGGNQLSLIDSTDTLRLEHIDALSVLMSESSTALQPVMLDDDPAAKDEPLYVFYVSHRAWNSVNQNTTGQVWRTFLQNAWNRAQYGSKHPIFKGEAGMWGNILVKRMRRNIRFSSGSQTSIITSANRFTGTQLNGWVPTETAVTINAALSTSTVERCLLLGGQALAVAFGGTQNGAYMELKERKYNVERASEFHAWQVTGKKKVRFGYLDNLTGIREATDHGVITVDVAAAPPTL